MMDILDSYLFAKYGPPYSDGVSLYEECRTGGLIEIHGLLSQGGDPRIGNSNDFKNTPLHYAVRRRNLRLCKMLVRAGADPQHVNELGQSSLSTACGPRARLELVEFLLDNGADVNHVDKAGHAPLDLVGGNLDLARLLLQRGAKACRETEFLCIRKAPMRVSEEVEDLIRAKERKERRRRRRPPRTKTTITPTETPKPLVMTKKRVVPSKPLPLKSPPSSSPSSSSSSSRDVLEEAAALLDDATRRDQRSALQRRWKAMTGLDLFSHNQKEVL
ncbi:hypothetical protein CTAYLR_008110 [Chrysophaeum taylorii]|uniref:Uncharacterized protein n=1 Tax=Chrysophaeum taylorii TaxID=2483200 RepID=A0AAD7UBL1_9STRA|nr:hypothetical protein CTAYLR_008110 [Chrysophaeum taylorii]